MDIKEKIKTLPDTPGVYLMKDGSGIVLYVGKSSSLRKRVSSYFRPSRRLQERIEIMVDKVRDISCIPTSTEAEALIYENSLIKQLAPKYNVALRDDKSYPMLKLTINEKYPRLFISRQKKDDGSIYYGPYSDATLLRQALLGLRQVFSLRSCGKLPKSVCLYYHIGQCLGPCEGKIDDSGYGEIVSELKMFLEGKRPELLSLLSKKMAEASRAERFEEAARIKIRLEALGSIREKAVDYAPSGEIEELKNILDVKGPLDVIEAFDVSNIMGKSAVGSMIYFYKGRPRKNEYRKFRIKTVDAIDDYSMMRELVRRRYSRLLREMKGLPDLILIDGGKGHLSAVLDELEKLGLSRIPAIGIAKQARLPKREALAGGQVRPAERRPSGGESEHIYLKDRKEPVTLPKESKTLHLLDRIRDEAHRFAITYHKSLLSKKIEASELDAISGIGSKRKRLLINHFGSVDRIKAASLDELLQVKGIDERSARSVIGYFKR